MTLWACFERGGRKIFGVLEGERLHVHSGDLFLGAVPTGEELSIAELEWSTPCTPSKYIGLWNNYRAAAAKQGTAIPELPLYFIKAAGCYLAHRRELRAPRGYAGRIVYEGELGIVIGRRTYDADPVEAAQSIFGYTCVNDVTALDVITADPSFPQWARAKSFDGFGPFGPVIATGLEPAALNIRTLVNGRERQNYPASDMIFSPAQIVSHLSRELTLEAGDLIACGTSLGVGVLKPGTRVEVEIQGIGSLMNRFVAPAESASSGA
jgi:2-keto-4-pentenoate hydratase/2-oxohepta-3-ene-1,7-dioic acid hydratase in catechol pathway